MKLTTFCVPLDVKPESTPRLAALIEELRRKEDKPHGGGADNFARISSGVPMLHFMSMSVFEHQTYDPIFIIEVNFDGPPRKMWAALERLMGDEIREMLRCCKEPLDKTAALFRKVTDENATEPVATYLSARIQRPSVFHHGNRGLNRDRILAEAKLFRAVRDELDAPENQGPEPYRGAEPAALRAAVRAKMEQKHPWLRQPGAPRITTLERALDFLRLFLFATAILAGLALPGIVAAALLPTLTYLAVVIALALVAVALIAKDRTPLPGTDVETSFSLVQFLIKSVPTIVMVLAVPTAVLIVLAVLLVGLYDGFTGRAGGFGTWIFPVITTVILGVLGIAVTIPWLVWWLRRLEICDHSQDAPPIDDDMIADMSRTEDWVSQNHMGSIVLVRPGMLRTIIIKLGHMGLGLLLRVKATEGYLGSMRTVHFAHWAFLNNSSRLLFFSNYDQSWGSYLDDFIEKAHVGLTLAWGCGVGFPPTRFLIFDGASHGRRFKNWALASRAVSRFWYSAYPELSVDQIERNHRVAEGLRAESLSQEETRAWMKDL